jgi:carboxyl-terminal processing protease
MHGLPRQARLNRLRRTEVLMRPSPRVWQFGLGILVALGAARPAPAQRRPEPQDYERTRRVLAQIVRDLRQYYYDSTFGGVDIIARARRYDAQVDSLTTVSQMMAHIAQFVSDLNDSHTNFYPPMLAARVDYGWQPTMIGDACYIAEVTPGSDAAAQGVRPGDRVLSIDGIAPTRRNIAYIAYVYYALSPRRTVRVALSSPDGERRELDLRASIRPRQRILDFTDYWGIRRFLDEEEELSRGDESWTHRTLSLGDTVMIWKMRSFCCGTRIVDHIMGRAREHRALILDLRGNGGGEERMNLRLLGHWFENPLLVGITRERNKMDTLVAEPARREPYRGMIVILIDSESASSSEIVAYAAGREERAVVIGDRSAGALMRSLFHPHEVGGAERVMSWALQITEADLIMMDGARLEGRGVEPHERLLPTPQDLAAGRDVQMARALEIVGVQRTPEEAARLFPRLRRR